jgi:hypothetical protein
LFCSVKDRLATIQQDQSGWLRAFDDPSITSNGDDADTDERVNRSLGARALKTSGLTGDSLTLQ